MARQADITWHWTDPNTDEEIPLLVTFNWTPGYPATGPTYACGGTPEEPPEVELLSADDPDSIDRIDDLCPSDLEAVGEAVQEYLAEHPIADDMADVLYDQARDDKLFD